MKFKLEIDMENAAFEDCNGDEVARILRNLAMFVACNVLDDRRANNGKLKDSNGNTVGFWKVQ